MALSSSVHVMFLAPGVCVCFSEITVCVLGHRLAEVVWEPNLHSARSKQMEMLLSANTRPVQKPTGEVGQTLTQLHTHKCMYTHTHAHT